MKYEVTKNNLIGLSWVRGSYGIVSREPDDWAVLSETEQSLKGWGQEPCMSS